MNMYRHANLFRNGRSQAVRIPKEFELPGTQVTIRKDGENLVLEPVRTRKTLAVALASLKPLGDDDRMPTVEDFPPEPFEL